MGMTHRERVMRALSCEPTDRVPYDLMEGQVWPELLEWSRREHDCVTEDDVSDFLDTDFRWYRAITTAPEWFVPESETYSGQVRARPLAHAETIADIEAYQWPDPAWWNPPDFAAARRRWPEHAIGLRPTWVNVFGGACVAFGFERALEVMGSAPQLFQAYAERQHEFVMEILRRTIGPGQGLCDICWQGDDYASQMGMLMSPRMWRRLIKPYVAEEVHLALDHGMHVIFHSCGAVRPILPDLIEIGVSALMVFQTRAVGMDAESIATEFGGRLAFYGGIDCQEVLPFGTEEQVREEVCANIRAFDQCRGYIVANAHIMADIQPENIVAMCTAARECSL